MKEQGRKQRETQGKLRWEGQGGLEDGRAGCTSSQDLLDLGMAKVPYDPHSVLRQSDGESCFSAKTGEPTTWRSEHVGF